MDAKELKVAASLPALLEILGHSPQRSYGQELIYSLSGEKACFAVNREHNIWYDHNTGKGGNIIDFAMIYWKVTFREALKKLNEYYALNQLPGYGALKTKRRHAQKLPHYQVGQITALGSNAAITGYLESKCIWEAAQKCLSEVYYYVEDEKGRVKSFYGAGLKNELDHWQICGPSYTGCLGHKAISFSGRSETQVSVFQDTLSYLSWQTDNPPATDSILVMHSPDLLVATIRKIKDFLAIQVWFTRDDTGRLQSAELIQALPQATDCSMIYKDYLHYNEMLVKRTQRTLIRR